MHIPDNLHISQVNGIKMHKMPQPAEKQKINQNQISWLLENIFLLDINKKTMTSKNKTVKTGGNSSFMLYQYNFKTYIKV